MAWSGNVQDERYDAVPWTIFCSCKNCISTVRGGHGKERRCQDERLIFAPCKISISHILVGRQDFVPDKS